MDFHRQPLLHKPVERRGKVHSRGRMCTCSCSQLRPSRQRPQTKADFWARRFFMSSRLATMVGHFGAADAGSAIAKAAPSATQSATRNLRLRTLRPSFVCLFLLDSILKGDCLQDGTKGIASETATAPKIIHSATRASACACCSALALASCGWLPYVPLSTGLTLGHHGGVQRCPLGDARLGLRLLRRRQLRRHFRSAIFCGRHLSCRLRL